MSVLCTYDNNHNVVCSMKSRLVNNNIFKIWLVFFLSIPEIEKIKFTQMEITYLNSNVQGIRPFQNNSRFKLCTCKSMDAFSVILTSTSLCHSFCWFWQKALKDQRGKYEINIIFLPPPGYCQGDAFRVGFGSCTGKILPALQLYWRVTTLHYNRLWRLLDPTFLMWVFVDYLSESR